MNMTLKVSHKGVILAEKVVEKISRDDQSFLNWMIDIYQSEFGINISRYSLSDTIIDGGSITLILNDKRLRYWRDMKLNQILNK
jgi:hypothetical protein